MTKYFLSIYTRDARSTKEAHEMYVDNENLQRLIEHLDRNVTEKFIDIENTDSEMFCIRISDVEAYCYKKEAE